MSTVPVFTRREQFVAFARERGLASWHEPDQAGVTARWTVRPGGVGIDLDNAMGAGQCYGVWLPTDQPRAELFVTICEEHVEEGRAVYGRDLCAVSLATLCEWASTPLERPAQVGDYIGPRGPIPANVQRVWVASEGDSWERVTPEQLAAAAEDLDDTPYTWAVVGGGGWSTDEGLLIYAPLKVTEVR